MRSVVAIVIALLFGVWAQGFLAEGKPVSDAVILYALAGALFIYGTCAPQMKPKIALVKVKMTKRLLLAVGIALLMGLLAFALFWQDISSKVGLALWLTSIPIFLAAIWPIGWRLEKAATTVARPGKRVHDIAPRIEFALLALIILVALFLRVYQIDVIPNGCQSDEGNNGLDALKWLRGAPYTPYAETNEGQATMFTYIIALYFKLLGVSVPTMRLVSATGGIVTVLAFYFMARYLFGARVGLATTALLAASRWHITFSRIGYEAILTPLFAILTFYFLLRSLRKGYWRDFALAGISLGLGLNTYTAFRLVPLVVVAFALYLLADRREIFYQRWHGLLIGVLAAALILVPLTVYVIQHPTIFIARTRRISIFSDITAAGNWSPLYSNLRKTLLMFNYRGDQTALNNLPGEPLLGFVTAVLFVLGFAYAIRYWRKAEHFLFIVWFIVCLWAGVLSVAHEVPTARRTIGVIPVVYLLAGLVIDQVWTIFMKAFRGKGERYFVVVLVIILTWATYGNYNTYFNVQAKHPSVWMAYSATEAAIGQYIASLEGKYRIYLASAYERHSAITLIAGEPEYTVFNLSRHLPIREAVEQDVIYILEPISLGVMPLFRQCYPEGIMEEHRDPYGRLLFISYLVRVGHVTSMHGLIGRYFANDQWEEPIYFERQEEAIDFDWSLRTPLPSPLSVEWQGSLLVPNHGRYVFGLQADGVATLAIDGETAIEIDNGYAEGQRTLVGGFHTIKVRYAVTGKPGRIYLAWSGPGIEREVIPSQALYVISLPQNGLVGYYYHGTDWQGSPAAVQKDFVIGPNNVLPVPFSIEWRGKIWIPRTGHCAFGTNSDDGSFVYIDGQLVVDNGGSHGAQHKEGSIFLQEGYHDITVRYFQAGGSRQMELWWVPPGGSREQVPVEQLIPSDAPLVKFAPISTPVPRATPPPVPVDFGELSRADLGEVHFVTQWGGQGSEEGLFIEPRGVAVDQRGSVYVADTGNKRVQKFDAQGGFVAAWRSGEGDFVEPFDLVVSSGGDVYVLDTGRQAVLRFSSEGEFVGQIGADLRLYSPRGLGIDADDNLYVADTGGSRIVKLSLSGQFLAQYGAPGEGPGQLNQPTDVAVDGDGRLYVVDTMNQRMQVLDSSGSFLTEWAIAGANTTDSPHIALGPSNEVYLSDPEGHRVLVYGGQGQLLVQFGGEGAGSGQFSKPIGVAFDNAGRVYVTDVYNNRVQVFELAQ